MKKVYRLKNLDCATCAAKMESAAKKLPAVDDARFNFMTQRLTLTAADDRFDEALDAVRGMMAKVEPDCRIVP